MNSVIPAPGNTTFLKMAEIASMYHLKMIIPATIYISSKNFLIYTDLVTGYVKIVEDLLTHQSIMNFVTEHMQPL